MMDLGKVVLVGRHERADEDMKWLWEIFAAFQTRAKSAMQRRWPDKISAWDRWNVMALVQRSPDSYGVIDFVEFHTYADLGVHPAPWMTERWRFVPIINHMDPENIPSDPRCSTIPLGSLTGTDPRRVSLTFRLMSGLESGTESSRQKWILSENVSMRFPRQAHAKG